MAVQWGVRSAAPRVESWGAAMVGQKGGLKVVRLAAGLVGGSVVQKAVCWVALTAVLWAWKKAVERAA